MTNHTIHLPLSTKPYTKTWTDRAWTHQPPSRCNLRYGCKSIEVLKHTHKHVDGMQIQKVSWHQLASQLPCSACIAGKYTEVTNLALSWTASTSEHESRPNERGSMDWGIVNKQYIKDKNTVFALYLDNHTGMVFGYPRTSRTFPPCLYSTVWHS